MSEQEKITLTLESPKVEAEAQEEVKDVVTTEDIKETKLTQEEQKMVDDFAEKIDVMETNTILQYGSAAQNKMADFSENALKSVKTKDLGDIVMGKSYD